MKNIDTEPQLQFPPTDVEIINALNWQSTRNTRETALKYFLKYYSEYRQYTSEQLDNISKNFSYIPMTMIWLMRIFRNNTDYFKQLYNDKLDSFFSIVDLYTTSTSTVSVHKTIKKPTDYLENAKEYIDYWIDGIISNKTFIAIPEHFVWTYRLSKQNCIDIARYIQKYIIDIPEYSKQLQKTVDYFDSIPKSWVDIETADKQPVRKRQPKTRKQKIKSAYKQVQKLHYLKSFNNINSIVPETIPGKTLLVTYNTVTKQLLLYQSEVINSLSVKGSTMYNCSTLAKRLRKPDIIIPEILSAGNRTEIKSIFKKLTTKESSTSNRINDNMLLLRVF